MDNWRSILFTSKVLEIVTVCFYVHLCKICASRVEDSCIGKLGVTLSMWTASFVVVIVEFIKINYLVEIPMES